MKVIISRPDLLTLISKIQNIVPAKPSSPILSHILLEATNDQLILTATDLMQSMRVFVEAKVVEEGGITLPARRFFQLVRELTAPTVEIHTDSTSSAIINSGASHFKIHGMNKEEFPLVQDISDAQKIELLPQSLKDSLIKTAFAAARDDSRQVLNGVLMQTSGSSLILVGTDGKKLAKTHTTILSPAPSAGSYILPIKAVEEIIRITDPKEEKVTVNLNADKVGIEIGSCLFVTKLIAGQYPDISRIIPEKKNNPIQLHKEELSALLRQMALFASESTGAVRFSFSTGQLQLSSIAAELGEGKVHMPANFGGEKIDIAFNPFFFLDILRHSKDETVNLDVTDSYNPGMITDSSNSLFILMPMRLDA